MCPCFSLLKFSCCCGFDIRRAPSYNRGTETGLKTSRILAWRIIPAEPALPGTGIPGKEYGFIEREGETLYTEKAVPRVRGQGRILRRKANSLCDTRGNMEAELRAAEEKYRSIFENAIEGICQSTMDGRLVTVNAASARMTGYDSPEEMIASVGILGHASLMSIQTEAGNPRIERVKGIEDLARTGRAALDG